MKKIVKNVVLITFILAIILVVLGIVAIVVTGGKIMLQSFNEQEEFDHLIVIGTTVEGRDPSGMLEDRIKAAGKYLEAHPDVICVVSGAKQADADISEALCMYNELRLMGIEHDRIWKEEKATTDIERIQNSLDLIEKKTGKRPESVGIVSSEFHLYRASIIAQSYDVQATTIPASTSNIKDFASYFVDEIFEVWRCKMQLKFS